MFKFIKLKLSRLPLPTLLIISIAVVAIISSFSDSNSSIKTTSDTSSSLTKEEAIEVKSESNNYLLHSLYFVDEKSGWVIEESSSDGKKLSKLLATQDSGLHWEKIDLKDMFINSLKFIDKAEGWAIAQSSDTMKILHTKDGGKSWQAQLEKQLESATDNHIWFYDNKSGYALVSGLLLSTRDGGKNWSPVSFGMADFTPQHMNFSDADTGWVIGKIQQKDTIVVLKTTDGGKNFNKQFEKTYADGPAGSIDINFPDASAGWFLTSNMATWEGDLYYTSNGGIDWKKINEIKCVRPTPTQLHFITSHIGWIPLNVGAGPIAGGLMFTNDGGKSFSVMGSEDGLSSASEVYFTSELQGWAIGRDPNYGDYLIHTTDGGITWFKYALKDGLNFNIGESSILNWTILRDN
jgi:photosystem II stability/assembly factor-like uncharacterized protein